MEFKKGVYSKSDLQAMYGAQRMAFMADIADELQWKVLDAAKDGKTNATITYEEFNCLWQKKMFTYAKDETMKEFKDVLKLKYPGTFVSIEERHKQLTPDIFALRCDVRIDWS